MRLLTFILLIFGTMPAMAQEYPFSRNFVDGTIILKDSTQKTGQLKWFTGQRLKFRENENADAKKYSPEDLLGFTTDTMKFVSLFNFEVYADNYALLGKTIKIKQTFGQLIHNGAFNIYFVVIAGYNAVAGAAQNYPNFIFQKKQDSNYQYAAYPFGTRMKDKRYEDAKVNLYIFFKDYPAIIEKIKAYKQPDNFFDIIDLVKKIE